MSTKAIRDAIEQLNRYRVRDDQFPETWPTEEVEAIRAAARILVEVGIRSTWHGDAWFASGDALEQLDKAWETLKSIAEDK